MQGLKGLILFLALIAFLLAIPAFVVFSTQLIKAQKNQTFYKNLSLQTKDIDQRIAMLNTASVNKALVKDRTEKLFITGGVIVFLGIFFKLQRI